MLRNITAICVVFALSLVLGSSQAWAGWGSHGWSYGSHGGSHGSWGSTASYGSTGSHGSYGSYGSMGSHGNYRYYGHGGVFSRWYYRHQATKYHWFGSWGSHGMVRGYGSYGSFGSRGSYGSYGSHGAVVSSCGSSGGSVIYGDSIQKSAPMETEKQIIDEEVKPMDARLSTGKATLTVNVPADAKVFVNGLETSSKGDLRKFVSRNLEDGFEYSYEVRAEVIRNGRKVEDVQTVKMTAGETSNISLAMADSSSIDSAVTSIKVHVPENAKVFLAGSPTKSVGAVRVFRTTKLAKGDAWNDYVIRVEMDEDGNTVTREQSITLAGGETREVYFDLNDAKVASR